MDRIVIDTGNPRVFQVAQAVAHILGYDEGYAEACRSFILSVGRCRFGPVHYKIMDAIFALTDTARFERIANRVLDATSWDDLLATP